MGLRKPRFVVELLHPNMAGEETAYPSRPLTEDETNSLVREYTERRYRFRTRPARPDEIQPAKKRKPKAEKLLEDKWFAKKEEFHT